MLFQGLSRKEIIQIITTDYKVSSPAIDKWIRAARPAVAKLQAEAEAIRTKETTAAITDAVKEGLLTDIEIEMVLCKIVTGGFKIQEIAREGVIIRDVTPHEMVAAARTIYTKRGSNAPTKTANTNGKGEDVKPPLPEKPIHITLNLGS